jgi:hypothetical protein
MFERARAIIHRLTGRATPTGTPPSGHERRHYPRFETSIETMVRTDGADPEISMTARIQDVSHGGIRFILPNQIERGTMLRVELPSGNGHLATVLACVIHTSESPQGWIHGCSFSTELSDDDLQRFGAKRTRPVPREKRAWERYPVRGHAIYRLPAKPSVVAQTADILNLSATGIGLCAGELLEAGTLLSLDLGHDPKHSALTILACVVYVTDTDDGKWILGCNFIRELEDEDLVALL